MAGSPSQILVTPGTGATKIASNNFTDTDGTSKEIQRVTQEDRIAGEQPEFDDIVASPDYIPYNLNTTTTGQILACQGKRKLGYVSINKAGGAGSTVAIYDHYYQALNPVAVIDATVVGVKHFYGRIRTAIFVTITSSGAVPDVTIGVR